jgi:hypothetical protein
LVPKKSGNLSRQKKSRNLSGLEKITQPLGTKTNFATSQDKKKSCNLLGKKIKEPLGTKKTQTFGTQKIMLPFRTKKIPQSLGGKKITQPLGTKKITEPLGTK